MIDTPLCGCGAGFCRLDVKTTGPNSGRKFFICPIKKGQGACNFFMWQDGDSNVAAPGLGIDESVISPKSTLTNLIEISPADSDLVEETQPINLGQATTSQCSNDLLLKSGLLKRNKLRLCELKGSEDISDRPLTRHSKRLRQGDSESDGSPSGSSSKSRFISLANSQNCLTVASVQTLETGSHHGQMRFWKQSFTNEETTSFAAYEDFLSSCHHSSRLLIDFEIVRSNSWILAAIRENLCLQIQGWWGRLVFPPPKCLTEPPQKPFFCYIYPSFDPIFNPPNVNLLNTAAPLVGNSTAEPVSSQGKSIMRKFVSKAFIKAAKQIHTDLLTILRPLDIKDHEIMALEADAAFDALDLLGIDDQKFRNDDQKFREQVKVVIQCSSLLAKIEQSISSDCSLQKLADCFTSQELKLCEIKDAHARAIDTFSASVQRAAYLSEQISHLKDKLFQTEAELSCCKAESTSLKAHISQMSRDEAKFEQSLQITCNKLKNARELRKKMDGEREAAETALAKAKALLWR